MHHGEIRSQNAILVFLSSYMFVFHACDMWCRNEAPLVWWSRSACSSIACANMMLHDQEKPGVCVGCKALPFWLTCLFHKLILLLLLACQAGFVCPQEVFIVCQWFLSGITCEGVKSTWHHSSCNMHEIPCYRWVLYPLEWN